MVKKLDKKQKPKLNEDVNEIAFRVVQESTSEKPYSRKSTEKSSKTKQ